MSNTQRILLSAALVIAVAMPGAAAKPGKGSLSGVVLGTRGAPVAAAEVFWQAADGKSPHAVHVDANGRFHMGALRPGLYELRAEAGGMWSEWEHNVLVRAGADGNVSLRLVRTSPPVAAEIALKGQVREWVVPMVDDPHPHDAAVDPQGRVWVTLQNANQLARLDPATSEWKFFLVPTQNGKPHGITSDAQGNIWFTESGTNKIGRVDASSGLVTEYVPQGAEDVHTPAFSSDGTLWFTAATSDAIMRLDPATGEIKAYPVPTPKAIPNTIALGPDGGMWFCEFGTNKLGRLDPKTGGIVELAIPDEKERPRRIVISGHAVYFTDYGGRLGRYDIDAKKFDSWPSPSGAGSQPYGIGADSTGKIWYYEMASNQLVRFDPATEKFSVITMPTAKSNVVAMARDAHGHVWMPLSGSNKIADIE